MSTIEDTSIESPTTEISDALNYNWDDAPIIGTINGYKYALGPECETELPWDEAVEWCNTVGGELPSRDVLLLSYMNTDINPEFNSAFKETDYHYWSSTKYKDDWNWVQFFSNGRQNVNRDFNGSYVRAVRKVAI